MALADAVFIQGLTYSAEQTRRFTTNLLQRGSTVGSALGGIFPSSTDFVTTYGGSGLGVSVSAGEAWVPGSSSTTQGAYYVRASTATSLTPAAANPSNPRIDLVYLQVNDVAYTGGTNNATCSIATGTPTSGATLTNLSGAPSLPTSSLAIAYVLIPANASSINSSDILNEYPMVYFGPNIFNKTTQSSTYSAKSGDHVVVPSGTFTITLPAPFPNARVKVTNYGSGQPTVTHNSSEVIYGPGYGSAGVNTITIGTYGMSETFESDGVNWFTTSGQGLAVNLFAKDSSLGTPPSVPGQFLFIAGGQGVTFTSGSGTLTFPSAFPNGCHCVVPSTVGSSITGAVSIVSSTRSAATLYAELFSGSAFSGSLTVSYLAIGY